MNIKKAILISHSKDFLWAENKIDTETVLIAHSQDLIQLHMDKEILYFYPESSGESETFNNIEYLSHNWYRDSKGIDLSIFNQISIGQILNTSGFRNFTNYYREYEALKNWTENYDEMYISKNESNRFMKVAEAFGEKIHFFDPDHDEHSLNDPIYDPEFPEFPEIHFLSSILRFIQKPLFKFIPQKSIYFPDWTYKLKSRKDKNSIIINFKFPWKGVYYLLKSDFIKKSGALFPDDISEIANKKQLNHVIRRKNIELDNNLVELFVNYLNDFYKNNRELFIRTSAVYWELFSYYKPEIFIIPGEEYAHYAIIVQIAKMNKVKLKLLLDGYLILPYNCWLLNKTNTETDIDIFGAFGKAGRDCMLAGNIIKNKSIEVMKPPLLDAYKRTKPQKKVYDVIIMTSFAYYYNPNARYDYNIQIALDIIELALEMGFNKIALKVKSEFQREYFENIFSQINQLGHVDVLCGMLYEHISKTDFFIGGISTAIAESYWYKVPYYIYEPYENGYSDDMIEKSPILDHTKIARNIGQLKYNIVQNENAVIGDREYWFN